MNSVTRMAVAGVLGIMSLAESQAGEWDVTGFFELNSRVFDKPGHSPDRQPRSTRSLAAQPEAYWSGSNDRLRFSAVAFGRHDSVDDERSHLDIRELNIGVTGTGWDVNVGVNKTFWGVTEARHLVDVINQTDFVEDIDEEAKLGQPMLNLNLNRDFGRLELYVLPRFRERTFPGSNGRLGPPAPVDTDAAIFESRDGKRHKDVALRYSQYFGNLDFGAYLFDGTSREPRLAPTPKGRPLPVYDQMQQFGADLQFTGDAWLFKLETIRRNTVSYDFSAAVAGLEYTFFGIGESPADIGVLFEFLYDGRNEDAPPTVFDDDVFIGTRLALNDTGDTSVLVGAVIDTNTTEAFINVEASRRIRDLLTLDANLRLFNNSRPGNASHWLNDEDYLELAMIWYF